MKLSFKFEEKLISLKFNREIGDASICKVTYFVYFTSEERSLENFERSDGLSIEVGERCATISYIRRTYVLMLSRTT